MSERWLVEHGYLIILPDSRWAGNGFRL